MLLLSTVLCPESFGNRVELFFPAYLRVTRLRSESNYCLEGTTFFKNMLCNITQTNVREGNETFISKHSVSVLCD